MTAKFFGGLTRALAFLATVIMAVFFTVVLLGVFFRYVLSDPLTWSEEAARYLNIWSVFLGAAVAVYGADHLRVDILDRYVSNWSQRSRSVLGLVLIAGQALFAWSLLVGGWFMALDRWGVPLTTLPVHQGWVYVAAPASAALMLLFLAEQAFREVGLLISGGSRLQGPAPQSGGASAAKSGGASAGGR